MQSPRFRGHERRRVYSLAELFRETADEGGVHDDVVTAIARGTCDNLETALTLWDAARRMYKRASHRQRALTAREREGVA